ncbi:MAG: hypothetical protein A2289_01940 [Deltaproteobacteria bacterium RIFOXYA12_FULL_58_15]|nr:MAG: hypothetical protein A2289_01940 [Deltaproteobacteria bacterium RIFOXYA12_FULL_58_15]OGR14618.1 MAG: hypothetical protein A2341_07605 [Deltaproteobacteria bacterium RIFOXYB12_FULL_58_9]
MMVLGPSGRPPGVPFFSSITKCCSNSAGVTASIGNEPTRQSMTLRRNAASARVRDASGQRLSSHHRQSSANVIAVCSGKGSKPRRCRSALCSMSRARRTAPDLLANVVALDCQVPAALLKRAYHTPRLR